MALAIVSSLKKPLARPGPAGARNAEALVKSPEGRKVTIAKLKYIIQQSNKLSDPTLPHWRWKWDNNPPKGSDFGIVGWEWSGDVKFKGNNLIYTSHGILDQETGGPTKTTFNLGKNPNLKTIKTALVRAYAWDGKRAELMSRTPEELSNTKWGIAVIKKALEPLAKKLTGNSPWQMRVSAVRDDDGQARFTISDGHSLPYEFKLNGNDLIISKDMNQVFHKTIKVTSLKALQQAFASVK
jgi:hypothetical protein